MIHELHRTAHRLRSMLGRGRITLVDDSGPVQRVQIDLGPKGEDGASLSIRDNTARHAEFGFSSNPPEGSDAVVLHFGGDRSNSVLISTGHQTWRLKNLAPGESALHDQWGNVVKMTQAGVEITHAAAVTITAPKIVLAGSDIELGGPGGRAVARVGDAVDLAAGTIASGSANVTAT